MSAVITYEWLRCYNQSIQIENVFKLKIGFRGECGFTIHELRGGESDHHTDQNGHCIISLHHNKDCILSTPVLSAKIQSNYDAD